MNLKCEDCGWEGLEEECKREYKGVPFSGGDVELTEECPNCNSINLIVIEGEELLVPV